MNRKKNYIRLAILLFLWMILTIFLQYFLVDPASPVLPQFVAILVVIGFTALPAYFSSKILVPKFLYRKKIAEFIGVLILTALVNTIITYFLAGAFYFEISGKSIFSENAHVQLIFSFFFIANCIVIIVSSAVQIIVDRFGIEQQLHQVESEKDYTELAFLRAQINPHFLFNVLNTIYFQISRENSEARNSVEKLSEMLRYQLYECTTDKIDVSKELTYIRNYVALQQLRMEPGTDLQLKLAENIGTFKIAPLLILPLVENAFKHLSNFKEPKKIDSILKSRRSKIASLW